jgi:hypothetical protein
MRNRGLVLLKYGVNWNIEYNDKTIFIDIILTTKLNFNEWEVDGTLHINLIILILIRTIIF